MLYDSLTTRNKNRITHTGLDWVPEVGPVHTSLKVGYRCWSWVSAMGVTLIVSTGPLEWRRGVQIIDTKDTHGEQLPDSSLSFMIIDPLVEDYDPYVF